MKYERINKINTKIIVISLTLIIIIGSVLILNITKAKYKTTVSVPIVSGTIKYTGGNADLNVMAVYQQKDDSTCVEDNCYDIKNDIPKSGYKLNTDKSYCTEPGSEDHVNNMLEFESGKLIVDIYKKGTKCYLYFDTTGSGKTLKKLGLESNGKVTDFNKTSCSNGCGTSENGVYESEDDFGLSYYFRGTVDNNWLQFGNMGGTLGSGNKIFWRIIRINGDGSIRLIYAGNGSSGTSLSESDGRIGATKYIYNTYNNNRFVGYQYGNEGEKRGHSQNSNAYNQLTSWFKNNLVDEWNIEKSFIDKNVGFCVDRSSSTDINAEWKENMEESGGIGTTPTWYGADLRLTYSSVHNPTLKCGTIGHKNEDYFTYNNSVGVESINQEKILGTQSLEYPIGLITADEIAFAGGLRNKNNTGYWLNVANSINTIWTMTPADFNTSASYVYILTLSNGELSSSNTQQEYGLRPVINLKADTQLTFLNTDGIDKGTLTNPYIIKNS